MNYKKYIRNHSAINEYSGYTNVHGHKRELIALNLLNNYCTNNECSCGPHFPNIVDYKKNKYIVMSNQGIDIKKLKHTNFKIYT
jgi:hypothetical protein